MKEMIFNNNCRTIINGRVYNHVSGVVTIENGCMLVNGKPIEDWSESDEKVINITIEGNVDSLDVSICNAITVNGDANKVKTGSGDITVEGNVDGDVKTGSGDIQCGNVDGDVSTGCGDVKCGDVRGRVSTGMGDISRK